MCGKCDAEWSFEEVRKMALLTPGEVEEFEKKTFVNAAPNLKVKEVSTQLTLFLEIMWHMGVTTHSLGGVMPPPPQKKCFKK